MGSMRAMLLERPGPAASGPAAHRRPAPTPRPGRASSGCGSPPAPCVAPTSSSARATWPRGRLPIVPGHQVVGVVDAVGEGVEGWAVGDRAGLTWLAGTDGTCRFCVDRAREPVRGGARSPAGTATAGTRNTSRRGPTSPCGSPAPSPTSRPRRSCAAGSSGTGRCGSRVWVRRRRARGWACTALGPRPGRRSRSPEPGAWRPTSPRDPGRAARGPWSWGRRGPGRRRTGRRSRWTPP